MTSNRTGAVGLSRGWAAFTAGVLGAFVWGATMGSAPRYSFGAEQATGNFGGCLLGLAAVALVMGVVAPRHPWLAGATATAVPLVLAPGTAPRGDNDGLWVLVLPVLAIHCGFTATLAWMAAEGRGAATRRWRRRRRRTG